LGVEPTIVKRLVHRVRLDSELLSYLRGSQTESVTQIEDLALPLRQVGEGRRDRNRLPFGVGIRPRYLS
jgi:hypothetical protein